MLLSSLRNKEEMQLRPLQFIPGRLKEIGRGKREMEIGAKETLL